LPSERIDSNLFDRQVNVLLANPTLFSARVLLPIAAWLDLCELSSESLTRRAADLNCMISEIRSNYGRNVTGRIQENVSIVMLSLNYGKIPNEAPAPTAPARSHTTLLAENRR